MLTYDPDAFARCVKLEMERRDLSHRDLAAILGVSPATVARQLSGRRRIQRGTAARYADAFGIKRHVFFALMLTSVLADTQ